MTSESLAQLQAKYDQLETDYKAARSSIEKQMAHIRKSEQAGAVEKIRTLMTEYGLSAADLGNSKKAKTAKKIGSVEAKFRGPNGETWTGRGRQPRWVGDDREKFRIK